MSFFPKLVNQSLASCVNIQSLKASISVEIPFADLFIFICEVSTRQKLSTRKGFLSPVFFAVFASLPLRSKSKYVYSLPTGDGFIWTTKRAEPFFTLLPNEKTPISGMIQYQLGMR